MRNNRHPMDLDIWIHATWERFGAPKSMRDVKKRAAEAAKEFLKKFSADGK